MRKNIRELDQGLVLVQFGFDSLEIYILNYLNTNINMILEDPSFKKNLEKDGILVRRNSRIEFGDFMKSEFTKYAKIVKAIDLKVE